MSFQGDDQAHGQNGGDVAGDGDGACERITWRLVGGARAADDAADDAAVRAHIGSCLRCFRAAADLREVPRLQKLLRQAETDSPPADPGDAFWAEFPAAVGRAFDARSARSMEAEAPTRARTQAHDRSAAQVDRRAGLPVGFIDRFWAWLRLPVPAALAGAACAAVVAVMVLRPGAPGMGPSLPGAAAVQEPGQGLDGSEALAGGIGQEDISLSASQAAVDESVGELGEVGLTTMLDKLDRELGVQPEVRAAGADPDADPSGVGEAPGLPAASDELEGLDEQGLLALRAGLRESI